MNLRWPILVLLALMSACSKPEPEPPPSKPAWFEEVAAASGIDFRHERAIDQRFLFPEIMSGGAIWFDADSDGLPDLYLIQGGAIHRTPEAGDPGNRLYHNMGNGRFEEVTARAGVGDTGYGMGGAAADFDNDGDLDLYVTNVGSNVLYQNNGDGSFSDVSDATGVADSGWGSGAAFVDVDGDSDLDLFVVNYVVWSLATNKTCLAGSEIDYCGPASFPPAQDVLFRNNGDGLFTDVTIESGIAGTRGPGLGISANDFNDDGRIDLFVANDGAPNQLWINQGGGSFVNRAVVLGVAVNRVGMSEAGMGVSSLDFDHDGDVDLFMTHLHEETNTLYRNEGSYFTDATLSVGFAMASHPPTSFGVGIHDFDLDGQLDLFVANGRERKAQPVVYSDPYHLPNQLFRGDSLGQFTEVSPAGGVSPSLIQTSRAAAFADYDLDGDIDVAIVNSGGRFHLLRNTADGDGNWLLVGVRDKSGTTAIGARVRLSIAGKEMWRGVQTAYGYQSGNDPIVHFGLGDVSRVDGLVVVWPDGEREHFGSVEANRRIELRRGSGEIVDK